MHYNVVGQELWWLKLTSTQLYPSLKTIDICPLEHWKASWTCENVSEPNTDTGTQNETCVFFVGSSFDHTRTNGMSSLVFLIWSHKKKWDVISGVTHLITWEQMGCHLSLAKENLTRRNFNIQITSIAREWSLSTNCGFIPTIPNSNVKVWHGRKKRSKNSRKFGSRNRWGVWLVAFFNCRGMIYQHICLPQQRINGKY